MLRKIWYVAAKDLLQMTKDRMGLVWLIALPLLVMGIIGSMVSGSLSGSAVTATLPIVNDDGGSGATALIAVLRQTASLKVELRTDGAALEKAVRNGDQVGLLIIPKGYSVALHSPHPSAHVIYYAVDNNSDQRATIASYSVREVVQRMAWTSATGAAVTQAQLHAGGHDDPALTSRLVTEAGQRLSQAPPVVVQTENATGKTNYEDQAVPGYALMFALFGVSAGAGSILDEKEKGTFKRLLIAPLPPYAVLGGKMLSQFIQSVVQLTLLFAIGAALFRIDLGSSPLALALLVVCTSVAATGLSMVLACVVKTQRQLRPISTLIVLGFSAVGGSWVPLWLEPQWLQSLSKISITAWAMQAFNGLMIFDKGFIDVLPDIAALLIYGIVCLAVAGRLFRFREA